MATKEKNGTPPNLPATIETPKPSNSRFQDAGSGFENIDPTKDLQTPFLQIVQGLSPELKREKEKYIKGAEQGDIFNSVTRELYKVGEPDGKPIKVIPCGTMRVYNEWILRSKGGGFVKSHLEMPATHDVEIEGKKFHVLNDNPDHNIVETVMFSVLVLNDEATAYPAIMSMSGSLLSVSRTWISKMYARKICDESGKRFTPPMMDNLCEISTVTKKFSAGEAYIFKVEIVGQTSDDLYVEAKELNETSKERLALMAPAAAQAALPDKEEAQDSPY